MSEQPAADAHRDLGVTALHRKGQQQIEHDVVVVAGVQRDALFGAGSDHAAHHVERAVAVEGCHLDGDDVVDLGKAPPEVHRQCDAAHRGLQVEPDQRDPRGHRPAMCDQFIDRRALHRRQRQHAGVIPQAVCDVGLAQRLLGRAAQPGDQHRGLRRPFARGARRQLEHRLVQAALANRELGGMHAHRQAAGTGIQVVAGQRTLVPHIELALRVERQRVGRDDRAAFQLRQHVGGQFSPVLWHRGKSVAAPAPGTG